MLPCGFFFWFGRFIFGVVLLGFLLVFNTASHHQTMIQPGTDRAAPGRVLQRWGSFLRKDEEKIKIFHVFVLLWQ